MPQRLLKHIPVMRLAHLARVGWNKVRRPVTLGTRALIVDPAGQVLLIRHSYVGGWHMPGGGVDRGESIPDAVRREVYEETGLTVGDGLRLLGIYARFRHGASDHVVTYVVPDWSGQPTVDGIEITEAAFFAMSDLPPDTSPATRRRIAEYLGEAPVAECW